MAKAAGERLKQAPQWDELVTLLKELTQDSDTDVQRDSRAACGILGIEWDTPSEEDEDA